MNELEQKTADTPAGGRTLDIVAAEIRALTAAALNNIVEIGRRMHEAKEMLPHGEFGKWLKENTDYSLSTANNFMRLFDAYADTQGSLFGAAVNCQTFGNLSYSKALALLAVPAEEREEFVKENDVEGMSTRELQAVIRERDEARRRAEDAEKALADQLEEQQSVYDVDMADLRGKLEEAENRAAGYEEKLKQAQQKAEEQAAAAQEELETLKEELEALQNVPVETAVEKVADQEALNAAAAEARAETEAKLKARIEKAEKAKEKAEQAKSKAEQDLAALKVEREQADSIAEQEKKALANQVQDLQKRLAMASSSEITVFKLYFDQTQVNVNKMVECVTRMAEGGDVEGAEKMKNALKAFLAAAGELLG